MDSVIIFFSEASFEDVEREAKKHGFSEGTVSREHEHFYLSRYSENHMNAEHAAEELDSLRRFLGGDIESAFQVSSRHGANARFALQVVHALTSVFKTSVLDDDHGNLWRPSQIAACVAMNPEEGLYALGPDA